MLTTSAVVPGAAYGQNFIGEVLVTARKREERLQDVPAAVSAYNTEELRDRGVDNITEVARLTPNVTINETSGLYAGAIQVFIRGIGNDPGFDQGVGIYVDDVYLNRIGGALLDVYDVERIEVLKGPQGHLYGRNTIGGALKYVSREPDTETRIRAEGKLGEDSLRKVRANLSGSLGGGDSLFGSFAISSTNHDGYQTNLYDGSEFAGADRLALRGSLVWEASDSLRFKLVGDALRDDSDPRVPTRVAVNLGGPAGLGAFGALLSTANSFVPGAAYLAPGEMLDTSLPTDKDHVNTAFVEGGFDQFELDTTGISLTADWDMGDVWLAKSITALRTMEHSVPFDFDGSHQVFINTLQEWDSDDWSQELQLHYTGHNLNGVAGFYYLNGEYDNVSLTTQTPFLRLLSSHVKRIHKDERTVKSTSVYANLDWDLNEQWQISFGGRYTEDKKEIDQIADVTLTQHIAAFMNLPGLEQAPLVLSPFGAQVAPNLPFFNFFLPHRDLEGNIIGRGNTETVTTYPENKIGSDKWSEFTPSAKLSYRASEDVLLYAGVSTGFKSGGFTFTGRAYNAASYEPETVATYAAGMKSTLLDGSLRFNIEAFLNDYTDKQFTVIVLEEGSGRLVQTNDNAGKVETRGFEFELLWLPPVDGLAVNLNVGYLDVEVKELIDEISPGMLGNVADDRAMGYAPEWMVQARAQYTASLGGAGTLTFAVDADYRDKMYTDSPVTLSDPFNLNALSEDRIIANAFLTYVSNDGQWRVTLEGKNLGDKRVLEHTFQVSNFVLGGYNRGRTWGLTVAYEMN
ncbi:MAG: TonB-dependent receptor [Gammaproteobacteria bacterium]|nr:TonB-dependent receptor [Gammaproteobacteria bacterium]MDE0272503.1 TonB-dependent receptor [Gammaproteobacteria bacterium]